MNEDISKIDMDRIWKDDEYRHCLTNKQIEAAAVAVLDEGAVSDNQLKFISGNFFVGRLKLTASDTTSAAPICNAAICCPTITP